jgi:hypothetical protein
VRVPVPQSAGDFTAAGDGRMRRAEFPLSDERPIAWRIRTAHGVMTEGRAIVIKDREKLQRLAQEDPLIEEVISVKRRKR